jgi:predicted RNA-binding Zn-ribbon protein involved in translation (DUF1610 family)
MMTIRQHQVARWLLPIGILIAGVPVAFMVARWFPEVRAVGNMTLFGAILLAVAVVFGLQFAGIRCPSCGARLGFCPAKHSRMPRYTCKGCGFRER